MLNITLTTITCILFTSLAARAADATNWVAFNDHASGAGTAANVTTYSMTTGAGAGGPLTDFLSGGPIGPNQVGLEIIPCCGTINGTTGSSNPPEAGTPADQIFGSLVDFNSSAIYFAATPWTAAISFTFTNLDPGKRYIFRGTAVRGNNYTTRWTLATITGVENALPAHILGTGTPASPGIVTNGWSPFGDNLVAGRQAGWNSGENRAGDVIGWDDIVPSGTSFTVICSNMYVASPTVPLAAGGTTTINQYCYAFNAVMLAEVGEPTPVGIVDQPPATLQVEEFSPLEISLTVTGSFPRYLWHTGTPGSGTPIPGATSASYSVPEARLSDSGTYYVVVTNEINQVTSTATEVNVFVNPIVITQQPPATLTVVQVRPFSLSVAAEGTNPQYQWYREDAGVLTPIDGATGTTYSVESATFADAGNYVVVITNSLYNVTSQVAQVIISTDDVKPTVVRITGSANFDYFVIEYSEPVARLSAEDFFNYFIDPALTTDQGTLTNNGRSLILPAGTQSPDTDYTISIALVTDLVGNEIDPVDVVVRSWSINQAGGMVFEKFDVGAGNEVTNLTDHPNFPDSPDAVYAITQFNPTNAFTVAEGDASRNAYGGRVRGWFIPPFSGQWRLFLSSDDSSELWFNPAGPDAAGAVLVAFGTNCCQAFQEPPSEKTSEPFDLIAGQGYYVEALYKEGTGGDYFVAAARLEGDTTAAASLQWMNANSIGYPGIPPGFAGTVTVDTQPADVTVEDPNGASFSVAGTSSTGAPILYQWQRNDGFGTFTNLPGANGKTLVLASTAAALDNGAQFRALLNAADVQVSSSVATLTVNPDATGPILVSAVPDAAQTTITVSFSETLAAAGTDLPGNYTICQAFNAANCVGVVSATLDPSTTQVALVTDAPVSGAVYRLTVNNLTDLLGNPVQAPASVIIAVIATFQEGDASGYTGTQDTFIEADNPAANHGADDAINVDDAGPLAHGLLRFDNLLGAHPLVPLGATIQSATLTITTFDPGGLVNFYRMLQPWDESATWTSMGAGIQIDDVEANSAVDASIDSSVGASLLNVTASLQAWVDGADNHGWAMIHQGSGSDGGWDWRSSEYATVAERPLLTVIYTPSGETNPVAIVTQPQPATTLEEGDTLALSAVVSGTAPEFQWYKDTVAIAGATGPTLVIEGTDETDSGTYYVVVSNFLPSSEQSANAVVTVNPDTEGPALVSALGTSATTIVLNFDQPVDATSVGNLANYAVTPVFGGGAPTVNAAEVGANGTTVTLTTSARGYEYYQVTVQDITDTAYRLNPMVPNPTTLFLPFQVPLIAGDAVWKYNDLGVDLGTEWTGAAYDDTAWASGPALLWVQRFNNPTPVEPGNVDVPAGTMMAWTNTVDEFTWITNITYYLRNTFAMPAAAELDGLQAWELRVRPIIDDGALFYINGAEALPLGVPETRPLLWSTLASRSQGSSYRYEGPYAMDTAGVVFGGDNVFAAELHQTSLTSSDAAFAADVHIYVPALEVRIDLAVDAGGAMTLTWPPVPGYSLYEADAVLGPYTPVAGNPSGSFAIPTPLAPMKFYQLRNP